MRSGVESGKLNIDFVGQIVGESLRRQKSRPEQRYGHGRQCELVRKHYYTHETTIEPTKYVAVDSEKRLFGPKIKTSLGDFAFFVYHSSRCSVQKNNANKTHVPMGGDFSHRLEDKANVTIHAVYQKTVNTAGG